jgi:hypothetical protein
MHLLTPTLRSDTFAERSSINNKKPVRAIFSSPTGSIYFITQTLNGLFNNYWQIGRLCRRSCDTEGIRYPTDGQRDIGFC